MSESFFPSGNLPAYPGLTVQRLHGGEPILAPTAQWWESGVTFNTAAVYLPRSAQHDPLLATLLEGRDLQDPLLRDGVVVAHYRARPRRDPGYRINRSFTGLALFTPDTAHLLARHTEPVICPAVHPADNDYLGIEDPRITCIDDIYYAVYCGVALHAATCKASLCLARSRDLRCWEKLGALAGDLNAVDNKDGVLFPESIDGQYLLLHRPMRGTMSSWAIHLAISDAPTGEWRDCGPLLRACTHEKSRTSWMGAGSVPIPLGDRRYLAIFHTGHYLRSGRREYDLDAAILNFNNFDPDNLSSIVEARIDRLMVPETACELYGPYTDSVANVLFTCGSYVYRDDLYLLYGGGDTFVMSARINLQVLLDALEKESVRGRELLTV